MLRTLTALLSLLFFMSLTHQSHAQSSPNGHYAKVNGLDLYYEIHGAGSPLVLLHGGGSTIASNYGRVIPMLAKSHKVIAIELQAHGHTLDNNRGPLTFEQDADDVAELLSQLGIAQADIMGFSNGGTTSLQIALRHPNLVRKLVVASATYSRDGMPPGFFDGFEQITLSMMPAPLQAAYLDARPDDHAGLETMFNRDVARMKAFKDIPAERLRQIASPTLVINGDRDVVRVEHAVTLSQTIPNARLLILPAGHGDYLGEIMSPNPNTPLIALTIEAVEEFLME